MSGKMALALVLVCSGLAVGCRGAGKEALAVVPDGENGTPSTMVETVTLTTAGFRDFLELNGVTEPIRSANISAQMGGRIVTMNLVEGQPVTEGQEVLVINTRPMAASIDRMEIELEQLESDIERTQRLVDRGLATSATLEQLNTRRAATDAAIDEIRINLREARTRAPISGTVTETHFETGEFVGPGTPVARVVDIGTLIVQVGVPERDIIHIHQDMPVSVRIEASGQVVEGRIQHIGLEGNTRNRRFPVKVEIDNPDDHLLAGMRATVIILKRTLDSVVVIPRDAIVQSTQGAEVYVVEENQVRVRPVQLGQGCQRFVVVRSGLAAGEELVVRGQRDLVNNEPVTSSNRGSCCQEQMEEYQQAREDRLATATPTEPVLP
ncbi:MAG: efflux RND transporter periplasmic adaptor subunit [Bradymonadales bacterium]|nr:efflux RND transporter periplasmic adaptor subunit [Bradymonadales bacterium]